MSRILKIILAVLCLLVAVDAFATTDTFTSSGTWTCPTGVLSVTAEVWGAGGAGGAGATTSNPGGSGGGGGGYSIAVVSTTPGNSYTVTVGTAGAGGNGDGGVGGDSYFIDASTVMAKGGTGGVRNGGTPGGSGGAGVGDTAYTGGTGYQPSGNPTPGGGGGGSAGTGSNGNSASGQTGATAVSGGGVGGNGGNSNTAGSAPASGYGGGGGGGGTRTGGGAKAGGDGYGGKVVLTYAALQITVSGYAYADEAGTPTVWSGCGTLNIGISANGGTKVNTSCSGTDGSFSTSVPSPGDNKVITVFMDSAGGDKGVLYTRNSGTSTISNLKVTKNRIRIESETASSISNSDINTYDFGADTDIPADSDGTNLSTQGSGIELHVNTSDTYAAGGTITVANLHIKGSYSGASETLIITGSGVYDCTDEPGSIRPLCTDGGTFTPASNITRFTGVNNSGIEANTYNTLEFKPASGSPIYSLPIYATETITCNSNLVIGDGTNAVTVRISMNSTTLNVSGNLTVANAATFSSTGTGTVTVNGGSATGDGTINLTTADFILNGTGNFGGATGWIFNNLTFGNGGTATTTALGSGSITTNSVLKINDASDRLYAGSKVWILAGAGTPFVKSGTFTADTSTFRYTGTSATNITPAAYNILEFKPTSGSPVYALGTGASQAITTNNTLTIGNGTNAVTASTTSNSPSIEITGDLIVASSATLSGSGIGPITVYGGSVTGDGTINLTGGTFLLDGTGNFGGATAWNFNNLIFGDGTLPVASTTASGAGLVTVAGDLLVDSSQTLSGSANFTIGGSFTKNGGFTPSTGTVTFNDNTKVSTLLYANSTTFNNLTISTPSKEVDFDNVDQTNVSGAFTVNGGACDTKVKLYSDSGGNQFDLNVTGSYDIQYADIKDCNSLNTISATNSKDSLNNSANWTITEDSCGGGGGGPTTGATIIGNVDLRGGVTIAP